MGSGMWEDSLSVYKLYITSISQQNVRQKNNIQNGNTISLTIPTPVLSGSGSKGSLRISAIKIVNIFRHPLVRYAY